MTRTTLITAALLLSISNGNAASFTCGWTQCALNGISKAECRKRGLPLALNWKQFPRTSAQPGAVVIQTRRGKALGGSAGGHVSRIVSLTDDPRFAIVRDNRGTYRRDIRKNLVAIVSPDSWTTASRSLGTVTTGDPTVAGVAR